MDPTTLAAAATTLLAPYLAKAGEKLAESVGEKLPEQVGKLWGAITARFKGKPAAEEAAKDLTARPDDEDNRAAFRKELKKLLGDDADFLAELERLVRAAGGDAILNLGSGAAATGGSVAAGAGGIAVGGNVGAAIVVGNSNVVTDQSRSGGTDINADGDVNVGGDVTGRDKKQR